MSDELPSRTQNLLGLPVTVQALSPDVDLDGELWTFNRSNVRIKWMYNIYLRFATGIAYKLGARAHFMGYESKCLVDHPKMRRNIWLLIAYPTASHFLNLFTSKRFESMNLTIGTLSVKERLFAFSKRLDKGPGPPEKRTYFTGKSAYLIHYFQGEQNLLNQSRQALEEAAAALDASVYFMGSRCARLKFRANFLPSESDGAMIFEGPDEATLESLLKSTAYEDFRSQSSGDYIALYERKI